MAATSPEAAAVDEIQYGQDDGPCLQALRTGEVVEVTDMTTEDRWGDYPSHALHRGMHACLSLPLIVDGDSRGAMNLYAATAGACDERQRERALAFAAHAAAVLTIVTRHANQAELTGQLRAALAARTVIDQAIGVTIREMRCDADTAFAALRKASQMQNRKLRDVAQDVIRAVSGQPSRPGQPFNEPQ